MQSYRFSPISSQEQLIEAVRYVVAETARLAEAIIGQKFPVNAVKIFTHYAEEFQELKKMVAGLGDPYEENNGPLVTLSEPMSVDGNLISHLRVRQPDPYRTQVGCCDFEVPHYDDFKSRFLDSHPDNLRLIKREAYEMIEFFHPDFDVFAYVVSE